MDRWLTSCCIINRVCCSLPRRYIHRLESIGQHQDVIRLSTLNFARARAHCVLRDTSIWISVCSKIIAASTFNLWTCNSADLLSLCLAESYVAPSRWSLLLAGGILHLSNVFVVNFLWGGNNRFLLQAVISSVILGSVTNVVEWRLWLDWRSRIAVVWTTSCFRSFVGLYCGLVVWGYLRQGVDRLCLHFTVFVCEIRMLDQIYF